MHLPFVDIQCFYDNDIYSLYFFIVTSLAKVGPVYTLVVIKIAESFDFLSF